MKSDRFLEEQPLETDPAIGITHNNLKKALGERNTGLAMRTLDKLCRGGHYNLIIEALDEAFEEGAIENGPFLATLATALCGIENNPILKRYGEALALGEQLTGPTTWQKTWQKSHGLCPHTGCACKNASTCGCHCSI